MSRKKKTDIKSMSYLDFTNKKMNSKPSKSVLHVKNSKSKSNKHRKRGKLGKDCIYYNSEKLTCNNRESIYYNLFCVLCDKFASKNKDGETLSSYDDDYISEPYKANTHETSNEYIGISKNVGTPMHVGYLKSNDKRRHKARCLYYDKVTKKCKYYLYKCIGSNRCDKYDEIQKNSVWQLWRSTD